MINEPSALTVSIDNHVDIYPLNDKNTFYQVNEKDNIFIFGTNYIYRLKLKKSDIQDNKRSLNFEDWISYVIHAGICLLDTEKSELNLTIGISLKDYYQNFSNFSNIISSKKVKFLFNGSMRSKPIFIRQVNIYPNLYGHAQLIAANRGIDNFIVVFLSMETLEGIFFENDKTYLSQRYVLGSGYGELVNLRNSSSQFEEAQIPDEVRNSSDQMHFDQFYSQHIKKKVDFVAKHTSSPYIFYIETDEVSISFHSYMKEKLGEFGQVEPIYNGSELAASGLFTIGQSRKSNFAEDISMSVFPDHSTFVMQQDLLPLP